MFKVEIKKNNVVTHEAKFSTPTECEAWYEENLVAFGKKDRWVAESQIQLEGEAIAQAVEEMTEPVMGQNVKLYKFLKDHEVIYTDVTALLVQEKEKADALKYLNETDWYVIRKTETGVEVPANILTLRAAARVKA
jgi:hypothetical protein